MLVIQDKLISLDLIEEKFVCDLAKCKGACCWEGDFGAPLEEEEIQSLNDHLAVLEAYLSNEGWEVLKEKGVSVKYSHDKKDSFLGTPLLENGACVFMTYNEIGIAQCGIEQAEKAGNIPFKKPISCHLYPVRVTKNKGLSFEALNYDKWDICKAACSLGKKLKMPVYKFVKAALIRKYGAEFYQELEAAADHVLENE